MHLQVYVIKMDTMSFPSKKMNVVNLFGDSSVLFIAILDLYSINVIYQFE